MPRTWGIISDVHANLAALEAVLARLDDEGVQEIVCCGDVVGYGPWPNECVALVRERCACCVSGNHDAAARGTIDIAQFNGNAGIALRWTLAQLTPESTEFLQSRPMSTPFEGCFVTHGSPRDPTWEYLLDRRSAYANFQHFEEKICWFGHSHAPTLFVQNSGDIQGGFVAKEGTQILDQQERYLINPGSVGQPRDGNWRAAFAVYERGGAGEQVTFQRVEYDVERTCQAMRAANLPTPLYNRLRLGR
ncbi:MAG TPA: metallophosphoesterase family protein [Candidatus Bipolaricaulota bacterium]